MKQKAGLWIDHRSALIETLTEDMDKVKQDVRMVESNIEQRESPAAERHYGRFDLPAYDIRKRNNSAHLDAYYDRVIAAVRNAQEIFIFGPGNAKYELKKRLERNGANGRLIRTEAAPKLTGPQFVAKVRNYYNIGRSAITELLKEDKFEEARQGAL